MYDYFPIKQISDGNYYSERKRNGPNPLAESRIHRALYKKRLCRCLKPPDLSPRNRIAAFAQGPPPGELLATAMKRTGTAGPFCRPPRHSLQRQPSDHAPVVENITISDAAKIRKSCAAIRTNLNSRPIPPKSQDAEKLS